ncbi:hypothetical protein LOK49_LG04G03820 [Camellia lanceoleosa]|uniref:Uncharacterized protein n=1 Tax=Camellia lanceoleosa TaxID=1840588 RepID=A0ACC0I039_9ERIC|nr:hypothetical protein LOK49_LG04G03820 [Camellia lanceoleosa]
MAVKDNSRSDLQRSKEFSSEGKIGGKRFSEREFDRRLYAKPNPKVCGTEIETDQESVGLSKEMESPRSVSKFGQWTLKNDVYVHSQILRIREEDSHLGEDFGEVSGSAHHHHLVSSHMDVMIFSTPILPASPLSGKTSH